MPRNRGAFSIAPKSNLQFQAVARSHRLLRS
jgi:hypothetical protein